MSTPCQCQECIVAGCDRPVVRISRFGRIEELHGRRLMRFYAEQDERKAFLKRLGEQLMAKAREAQR